MIALRRGRQKNVFWHGFSSSDDNTFRGRKSACMHIIHTHVPLSLPHNLPSLPLSPRLLLFKRGARPCDHQLASLRMGSRNFGALQRQLFSSPLPCLQLYFIFGAMWCITGSVSLLSVRLGGCGLQFLWPTTVVFSLTCVTKGVSYPLRSKSCLVLPDVAKQQQEEILATK